MKALVADDNPIFQAILQALLTSWGYDVVVVSKGEEACEILQSENSPALAVLDWFMPDMTGVEVCRKVRARANGRYVYIILLTAKDLSGDVVSGIEAGADDYLTKPFNAQELRVRLHAGQRILASLDATRAVLRADYA